VARADPVVAREIEQVALATWIILTPRLSGQLNGMVRR
jgi:hypothetical protein